MKFIDSIRSTFSRWKSNLANSTHHFDEEDSSSTQSLTEGSSHRNASSDYTELHRGNVPCPSCKGTGLIPKELESTLVALIPVNDERLKPKRTCLIVTFWIFMCIAIGGIILFLLMPRTVTLNSSEMPIEVVHVTSHSANHSDMHIDFIFFNTINVTSGNYIPVDLVNLTVAITSKFQPYSTDVVGMGKNGTFTESSPLVLYRNTRELMFNNTVHLTNVEADYCQAPYSQYTSIYVSLKFDVIATLIYYYGHTEQVSFSMQQQVCCIPSGNCTAF